PSARRSCGRRRSGASGRRRTSRAACASSSRRPTSRPAPSTWSTADVSLPERICVLASGGLDSAVLLGTLARGHAVHPLYVRCGLAWERAEQRLLARFLAALHARRGLAVRALGTPVAIRAPFRHLEKAAVIRRGRDLPLALTLSCARPRGLRHCGRCTKCAERRHAFAAAGVPDPTRYGG